MSDKITALNKDLKLLNDAIRKAESDETAKRLYGVFEETLRDIKIERMKGNWEMM